MKCRYCGQEGADVKTVSYWSSIPDFCHSYCKLPGERQEALECQLIDADCNNCKHYQRGIIPPKTVSLARSCHASAQLTKLFVCMAALKQ